MKTTYIICSLLYSILGAIGIYEIDNLFFKLFLTIASIGVVYFFWSQRNDIIVNSKNTYYDDINYNNM